MEQQTQFWKLRHDMAPIARQISVVIPLDCDLALRDIKDPQIREYVLNIAAGAGIYATNRVWVSDPRVGLADLIIITHLIEQTMKIMAQKGPSPSLDPMIQTMTSIMADLEILGKKWLEPQVQAQIQEAIEDDAKNNWTPTADLMKVNELLTTRFMEPVGIQIDSSFLQNVGVQPGPGQRHQQEDEHKQGYHREHRTDAQFAENRLLQENAKDWK